VPTPEIRVVETKMTLRPLQDRVLIRRVVAETKTPGGIFIPDTAQEKPGGRGPRGRSRQAR